MDSTDLEKAYAKGFAKGLNKGKTLVIEEVRHIIELWHQFVPDKCLDVFMDDIAKRLKELESS